MCTNSIMINDPILCVISRKLRSSQGRESRITFTGCFCLELLAWDQNRTHGVNVGMLRRLPISCWCI